MVNDRVIIHVCEAQRASFFEAAEVNGVPTDTFVLISVKTEKGLIQRLVKFVAEKLKEPGTDGAASIDWKSQFRDGMTVIRDIRANVLTRMVQNGFVETAIGRAVAVMVDAESVIPYDKNGNAIPVASFDEKRGSISHICLSNSTDGKASIFAVGSDIGTVRRAIQTRSDGLKVSFAYLKKDSPEISASEVSARDSSCQHFFQALVRAFFAVSTESPIMLIKVFIAALFTGKPLPMTSVGTLMLLWVVFWFLGTL
jgi:hypothetical protein